MEKLLDPQITRQIQQAFEGIQEPVQVLLFTSKANYDYCDEARQLLEEVIALNNKLELSVYDIDQNKELASSFNVTIRPALSFCERRAGNKGFWHPILRNPVRA